MIYETPFGTTIDTDDPTAAVQLGTWGAASVRAATDSIASAIQQLVPVAMSCRQTGLDPGEVFEPFVVALRNAADELERDVLRR